MLSGIGRIMSKLAGKDKGGITLGELDDIYYSNQFAPYFPLHTYRTSSGVYHNSNDTLGLAFECSPLTFATENTTTDADALFNLPLPDKSVLQFMLYGDRNILPLLEKYADLRDMDNELVRASVQSFCRFVLDATRSGMPQFGGIPIRNFRLFVFLSIPEDATCNLREVKREIRSALQSMHLQPRELPPQGLLRWLRELLNDDAGDWDTWDENIPLNKQIILSETLVDFASDPWPHREAKIGNKHFKALTVATYPKRDDEESDVDPLQTNNVFGGCWGAKDDNTQYKSPFLYTLNIIFDHSIPAELQKKGLVALKQIQEDNQGAYVTRTVAKAREALWIGNKLIQQQPFVRIMPILWVFDENRERLLDNLTTIKTTWRRQGYKVQEDVGILLPLFLNSMPFGVRSNVPNAIKWLERSVPVPAETAIQLLPVQGDITGSHNYVVPVYGRKGQLAFFDLFGEPVK